jgi:hypothetical protein
MSKYSNHPLYRRHDIDSAMDAFWNFYKTRFVVLFVISFVFSLVTQLVTLTMDISSLQGVTDPMEMLNLLKGMLPVYGILSLVSLFFTIVIHAYILTDPKKDLNGILKSFISGFRYFLPFLVIIIVFAFFAAAALMLGLVVFIIGIVFSAIYVLMISLFILPVMMAEEAGIGDTISRTVKLSHTNFWSNIGWTCVFFLLTLIVSLVLSGLIMLPFAGNFLKMLTNPDEAMKVMEFAKNPVFIILTSVVNALTTPIMAIFAFILYFNGRAREDAAATSLSVSDDQQRVRVEDLYAKPRPENMTEQNNQTS